MDGWDEIMRPGVASVRVGERVVERGSHVVLRPRGDDLLARTLAGRTAIVDVILTDLEDNVQLAVVVEDDPARTLGTARQLGHRFFFACDEIEPLDAQAIASATCRVLVAGIGNVFFGDDGFGVAVVRRVQCETLPRGVDVVEFGIRGIDLAYALGDGYDAAILVDAAPRGEPPGTVSVIEPDQLATLAQPVDPHGLDPVRVLATAERLGGVPRRTLVVACEPAAIPDPQDDELRDELSAAVAAAVEAAAALVIRLATELLEPLEVGA